MTEHTPIRVAVIGAGIVGASVIEQLAAHAADLQSRVGRPIELVGVGVRDASKSRPGINPALVTTDVVGLASRDDVDIVIELMGGTTDAADVVRAALARGASVVTANKALIAAEGVALHKLADNSGADLYYEGAVAGAIPLLRPLRESFVGDHITKVLGIVNGTTNFILTQMTDENLSYAEALAQAQALGYAEADPTADVSGQDSAAKAVILARLAFHADIDVSRVSVEGIENVSIQDIEAAKAMGFAIKLLAVAELTPDEAGVVVRVHPTLIPADHPLASVRGPFNAVFVSARAAGDVMFYGRGAGGNPTASAVVGDLVTVARNIASGSRGFSVTPYADLATRELGEGRTSYYVNVQVADEPGVLATVATAFADNGVSIQVVRQDGAADNASLVLRTHIATDAALSRTVETLRSLPAVRSIVGVMRVEG